MVLSGSSTKSKNENLNRRIAKHHMAASPTTLTLLGFTLFPYLCPPVISQPGLISPRLTSPQHPAKLHKSGTHMTTKALCDDVHSPAVLCCLPTSLQTMFFLNQVFNKSHMRRSTRYITKALAGFVIWFTAAQWKCELQELRGKKELVRGGFWESALRGGPNSQSRSFVERCSSGKAAIQPANSHISSAITNSLCAAAASLCGQQHTNISSHNHIIGINNIHLHISCILYWQTLSPYNNYICWNKLSEKWTHIDTGLINYNK